MKANHLVIIFNQYAQKSGGSKAVAACLLTKYLIQTFNFNLPLFSVRIITLSKYHIGENGRSY